MKSQWCRWMVRAAVSATILALFLMPIGRQPAFAQSESGHTKTVPAEWELLDQYCIGCHNDRARTAGLSLEGMDLTRAGEDADIWEKVVRKVRAGMMPPVGMPRPERNVGNEFAAALEARLDRYAAANPNPGSVGLHRLNRHEYANAIRDLLALDVDVTSILPADDASFGFDNIANSLGISSALLEGYLSAASKISRLAIGDPDTTSRVETFPAPADLSQNDHIEGLPLGTRGGMLIQHNFPADGEYRFQIALLRGTSEELFGRTTPGEHLELSIDGERIRVFDIDEEQQNRTRVDNVTQPMEVTVPVPAGEHEIGVAFTRHNYAPAEDVFTSSHLRSSITVLDVSRSALPHVNDVTIGGPFEVTGVSETPSRALIFSCYPAEGATAAEEAQCAKQILSTLARRSYRRPVNARDMKILMDFYQRGREMSFEQGIEIALRRILASPVFLFRIEDEPDNIEPGTSDRISDLDLASRLSFFLWSSIPDDELLDLAAAGKLRDPDVLASQVRRMIADPRSSELVSNFAGQWLQLRNLASASPSADDFPAFDDNLRKSFQRETELFFDNIVHEDRSVLDLLTANYTFADERLARHYGIPNVYGSQFRRVSLAETPRRGLLGQGSILTVTSLPNRTSPVARGKWILENILGAPPPSPPPNVPALKTEDESGEEVSLRQRMELHRSSPNCAGCHRIMDPIGFSLENFDAVGHWRAMDGNEPIDASGQLADGTMVDGPETLRQVLIGYSDLFVENVTEKLLTYALGRGVQHYDMPTVRSIVRDAAHDDYKFSSIVMGIVESMPFQMQTKVQDGE